MDLSGRILLFQGQYREREIDINFHILPTLGNQQKVTVTDTSNISESTEHREVSQNKNEHVYEDVTIIKRVIERTFFAENIYVSVQAKHNLALRAEFMCRLDFTLNDS